MSTLNRTSTSKEHLPTSSVEPIFHDISATIINYNCYKL